MPFQDSAMRMIERFCLFVSQKPYKEEKKKEKSYFC